MAKNYRQKQPKSTRYPNNMDWFARSQRIVGLLLLLCVVMLALFLGWILPAMRLTLWLFSFATIALVALKIWITSFAHARVKGKIADFLPLERLFTLNPFDVEKHVAHRFRAFGFEDVRITQTMADGGIDVLATYKGKRYGVQVKRYAKRHFVKVDEVRALLGSREQLGLDKVIFVTTSDFGRYTWQSITKNNIFLMNGRQFEEFSRAANGKKFSKSVEALQRFLS